MLIAVEPQTPADGDKRVEFLYDYIGRRVKKDVFTYASGSWLSTSEFLYLYDGWNLAKEITTPNGQSSATKTYVWGLDLSQSLEGAGGIGGLIAVIDNGTIHYYCYDANGNVGQLVNAANGTITVHYDYDPFGKLYTCKVGSGGN